MSTIDRLVETSALLRIDVAMGTRDQHMRLLYGTRSFTAWLDELLKGAEPKNRLGDATPAEQIDELFHAYLTGMPLVFVRQFRTIRAEKGAVWEFKTPDIRIFGWFMKKDCFVGVFGNWADEVKDHDLYRGYRIQIRRLRRDLGIDDTLCVQGVAPGDVISL
jgi:hypothetical protein